MTSSEVAVERDVALIAWFEVPPRACATALVPAARHPDAAVRGARGA